MDLLSSIKTSNPENSLKIEEAYVVLQDLKKLVTDSASILPSYELRQAQKTLENLENSIGTCKTKFVPKKKFAFKSKTNQKEEESMGQITEIRKEIQNNNVGSILDVNLVLIGVEIGESGNSEN